MKQVMIIGGGTVGLVSALFFTRSGYRAVIYESQPDPRTTSKSNYSSGNVTLSERGLLTFASLGLREQIERIAMPLSGQQVHSPGKTDSYLNYSTLGEKLFCLTRGELDRLLLDVVAQDPNISLHFNSDCSGINTTAQIAYFGSDKSHENSSLQDVSYEHLIIADGPRSKVRLLLVGQQKMNESITPTEYRFLEFKIPATTEIASVFTPGFLQLWPRGNYFVIGFPNRDASYTGAFFTSTDSDLPPKRFIESFCRDRFHEELADLIHFVPDLWSRVEQQPLRQLTTVDVSPWSVNGNVTLLGDAAHVIVPFLGQGMNAGLEDCQLLADALATTNHDWAAALTAFEATRRIDMASIGRLSRAHFERLSKLVVETSPDSLIAIEQRLAELFPNELVTPYQLIEFSRTPYAECEAYAEKYGEMIAKIRNAIEIDSAAVRSLMISMSKSIPISADQSLSANN